MSFAAHVVDVDRAAQEHLGGELVTYLPEGGPPVEVIGIFDESYVLATGRADAGVEAVSPAITFRLEDLPVDPEDDDPTITIRGVDYRVTERIGPDGMGGITLQLRRVR